MNRVLHAYRLHPLCGSPAAHRLAGLRAAAFVAAWCALGGGSLPARAADDTPPPPPPPAPSRSAAKGVADPTSKDFRGALLGDSSSSRTVGDERVVTAVGGSLTQPVWVKLPGLELRCDGIVLWGDKNKLGPALEGRESSQGAPDSVLGSVLYAAYAEGRVFMRRDGHVVEADAVFVDFRTNRASLVNARLEGRREIRPGTTVPLVVRAAKIRQTAKDRFEAENATFAASGWEKPQIQFTTDHLDVDLAGGSPEVETSWWPTVRMDTLLGGSTPVLPVPKLGGSFGSHPIQSVVYGTSSRTGVELGLGVGGKLKDVQDDGTEKIWGTWQVTPRWRSARGTGVEASVEHESEEGVRGHRSFYDLNVEYQFDTAHEDRFSERGFDGDRRHDSRNDRGAGDFYWRNVRGAEELFGEGSKFDMRLSWWSDRGYIPEYHPDRALQAPQQESFLSLTRAVGDQGFSALVSHRFPDEAVALTRQPLDALTTDYATQTSALPSLTYHLVNRPLWGPEATGFAPINLSIEASAAHLDRRFDERTADRLARFGWRSSDVTRGDVATRLTLPFSLGPVRVTPSGGASVYRVSDANGFANTGLSEADDSEGRSTVSYGLRLSTEAHRNFDVRDCGVDLDGLRHVISADADWYNRTHVSDGDDRPERFQVNDLKDELAELNVVSLRLRNRLQTKRSAEVIDWFDTETRFLWFADPTRGTFGLPLGVREDFATPLDRLPFPGEEKYRSVPRDGSAFLQHRAKMRLLENLWLLGEADHDFQANRTETSGAGIRWAPDSRYSLTVGRRTIAGDSAVWTLRGDAELSQKWAVSAEVQQDTKADRGLRTVVGLYRRAREYTIAVEFQSERLLDEAGIGFAFYPHNWLARKGDPFLNQRPLDYDALRWYR